MSHTSPSPDRVPGGLLAIFIPFTRVHDHRPSHGTLGIVQGTNTSSRKANQSPATNTPPPSKGNNRTEPRTPDRGREVSTGPEPHAPDCPQEVSIELEPCASDCPREVSSLGHCDQRALCLLCMVSWGPRSPPCRWVVGIAGALAGWMWPLWPCSCPGSGHGRASPSSPAPGQALPFPLEPPRRLPSASFLSGPCPGAVLVSEAS